MISINLINNKANKKAFTLAEMIIVVIIIGIITTFALPKFTKSMEKERARRLESNLTIIHSALEIWEANAQSYPANGSQDLDYLNNSLRLNILDSDFNYTYTNNGSSYTVDAQKIDNSYTIRLTEAPIGPTNPSCQQGTCP
ncbi:MAG: hypothetical protein A2Y03_07675 [Omnitrophica WOR_2 bacterium GWF2_38_59]|nr:MAG: hypothetical protein A2Y03_07675 [Omnitrophica WOR_2 bacterium GWF2_38_59]OGX49447.1 MAG: hypothetical protein A2243_09550 [Omnitrophica WOR_2 bacterium RIFOXYA2_FULL_38_17]OGX55952.1 MAG: hypothetical protein A2306_12475 [Omnitrophica WOR_2 bacterium RIFOXYB2_FULL_38_16]OGX57813.1 MAG: hypothetical protein A2447_06950 [Omnitrophica WOR_2 bacterium RIFOXYC2_FULL_38_12]